MSDQPSMVVAEVMADAEKIMAGGGSGMVSIWTQDGAPINRKFTRHEVIDALEYLAKNAMPVSALLGGHVPAICGLAAAWLTEVDAQRGACKAAG
jgi:hypothetical protein